MASRSPSPIRLNPSTVNIIASPGKIIVHGADWIKSLESASILPHSGVGACAPSPKNPSAAASKIAVAMARVPCTITGAIEFGNIWEKRIRLSFIPIPFAAIMYSSSLMLNTLERINLPKFGTLIIAIAIKAFRKDGPKTATIDIASRIDGMLA